MGKMGGSRRLKRHAAPAFWPIERKEYKWVVKPSPGPHPIDKCIPLLLVVRDILGYAESAREAKLIIGRGMIKVDGRVCRDHRFPLGLMDVLEIPKLDKRFRLVPHPKDYLCLHEIGPGEASFKLCRIEDKTIVKGGHIQLNLHDGRNVLIRVSDPRRPAEDVYKTMDVVKLSLPDGTVLDHLKFEAGAVAIITGGRNLGRVGRIVEVSRDLFREQRLVTLEGRGGERFSASYLYTFVIGSKEPAISLPEGYW